MKGRSRKTKLVGAARANLFPGDSSFFKPRPRQSVFGDSSSCFFCLPSQAPICFWWIATGFFQNLGHSLWHRVAIFGLLIGIPPPQLQSACYHPGFAFACSCASTKKGFNVVSTHTCFFKMISSNKICTLLLSKYLFNKSRSIF